MNDIRIKSHSDGFIIQPKTGMGEKFIIDYIDSYTEYITWDGEVGIFCASSGELEGLLMLAKDHDLKFEAYGKNNA